MGHDWLVHQLDAMGAYAANNGLFALAEKLHCAKLLALTEIASVELGQDTRTSPDRADRKDKN